MKCYFEYEGKWHKGYISSSYSGNTRVSIFTEQNAQTKIQLVIFQPEFSFFSKGLCVSGYVDKDYEKNLYGLVSIEVKFSKPREENEKD